MIKAIIFDLGGVCITDGDVSANETVRKLNFPKAKVEEWWNSNDHLFFTGKISEDQFWRNLLIRVKSGITVETLEKKFRMFCKSFPEVFELIKKLKKHYKLAILTNNSEEWLTFQNKKFDFKRKFDVIVSSHEIGVQKPNKKIYRFILGKLNCNANECIFIDNKRRNLKPAKQIGMKIILFKNFKQFKKELYNLL